MGCLEDRKGVKYAYVVSVYDTNAVGGVGKRGWGMAACQATVADGESPGQCQAVLAPLRQTAARAPGDTAGGADASARQSASVGGGHRRVLSSGLREPRPSTRLRTREI